MKSNNGIKVKEGKCKECPADSKDVPLIAGRCKNHYWEHRATVSKGKKKEALKQPKESQSKESNELKLFFDNAIAEMPDKCQECGKKLFIPSVITKRAAVAHILPKRNFKSIEAHPENKFYLCPLTCHADMDNRGSDFVKRMKLFPEMKRIVQQVLMPLIDESEYKYIPDYFL